MDAITLEIFNEALVSTVAEMRVTLTRTAFSSVVYEGQDFSCALLDARGRFIAQTGDDAPIHVVPLARQTEDAIEYFGADLHPGDVFLCNDPYTSGTHLNDVAVISPIFVAGELVMLSCIRVHWSDVGGMTPGSLSGRTTEIQQEGVRIPLMKIYKRGEPNKEVLELMFANMRHPRERRGDFLAMLSAKNIAQERISDLLLEYSPDEIRSGIDQILDRTEERIRTMISSLPNGDYYAQDYLDTDGHSADGIRINVKVSVRGSDLTVDLTGSSRQCQGPLNASSAVAACAVFVTLKSLLDPTSHFNHGMFRPVHVIAPEGTVVNATYPAPTGGFVEVYRRISGTLLQALAKVVPSLVPGDAKGSANHMYIASTARDSARSILYEYPAGGTGAFLEGDGTNGMREWGSGDFASIQSAEFIEHNNRMFVERCELRPDSGGAGRQRGGAGIRREIRLESSQGLFSVLADRNVFPPFGVFGGRSGAANRFCVRRDGAIVEPSPYPGKVSGFPLVAGDTAVILTAGGGGYGDPLDREPARVWEDVREGYVSEDEARLIYGVVLTDGRLDEERTALSRAEMRKARRSLKVIALPESYSKEEGVQLLGLHSATAREMNMGSGDLIEVELPEGAPMRGRIQVLDVVPEKHLAIQGDILKIFDISVDRQIAVSLLPKPVMN